MKIDIKKIALIMAAGIFAFSGAFGQEDTLAQDRRDRVMPGRDGGGIQNISEIRLINKAENYAVSLSVNDGKGEIKALRGGKMGKEGKLQLKGGFIETIRLTFNADSASQIARKTFDTGDIRAQISGSLEERRDRLDALKSALAQKLREANLSATAEIKGSALVITIQEAAGARASGAETAGGRTGTAGALNY